MARPLLPILVRAALVVAVAGAALVAAPRRAAATPLSTFIQGEVSAPTLTLDHGSTSTALTAEMAAVTLVANSITIGGVLSASGASTSTTEGAPGQAGGMNAMGVPLPGGGGGFFDTGGPGTYVDTMCRTAGAGGSSFVTQMDYAAMLLGTDLGGSVGGGADTRAGASAGGHIILRAAQIAVDGVIESEGEQFTTSVGGAIGGGSGGIIEIYAYDLTGSGTISVKGGKGLVVMDATSGDMLYGGGGAGGLIYVEAHKISSTLTFQVDGAPTVAPMAACGGLGAGQAGLLVTNMIDTCIDADGDQAPSAYCDDGGDADCDDSNAKVKPGTKEVCDGLDNDCNGKVDDGNAVDECDAMHGEQCLDGGCTRLGAMPDASTGASDAGPDLAYLDFDGGCDMTQAATPGFFALGGVLAAAFARALRLRRRRRA